MRAPPGGRIGDYDLIAAAVSKLADKLPVEFVKQLDEWATDNIRLRRYGNLIDILDRASQMAQERGLDMTQARTLALHVGLPWVEKASLCEDEFLKEAWAKLFLAQTTDNEWADYDMGTTYIRILTDLDPWDCKVLAFVVERGYDEDKRAITPIEEDAINAELPPPSRHAGRNQLSVEKLIGLGCVIRVEKLPLSAAVGSIYGGVD